MKNYTLDDYEMLLFNQFKDKAMEYETLFSKKYQEKPSYNNANDIPMSDALMIAMVWYLDAIEGLEKS